MTQLKAGVNHCRGCRTSGATGTDVGVGDPTLCR